MGSVKGDYPGGSIYINLGGAVLMSVKGKNCEGTEDDGPTVSIARMPEQIIPKSIATPGLLAHIMTAKFADAAFLPTGKTICQNRY